tara:strand:+ start:323 stop:1024 length:702 start_codon:yes stop_codon:yes gene_type:complete
LSNIEFHEYSDLEKLSIAAVEYFVDLHKPANKQTFLVPGGKTPINFYKRLALSVNDWTGTSLLLSDERFVPEQNIMSNIGMVKRELINNIAIGNSPEIIEYFNSKTLTNIDQALYTINSSVSFLPNIKAAFLGIGLDGHTASLFPDLENLFFKSPPFIKISRSNESFDRISISANLLVKIPNLIFLVSGRDKRNILKEIRYNSDEKDSLPVKSIIQRAKGKVVILCDQDAASF